MSRFPAFASMALAAALTAGASFSASAGSMSALRTSGSTAPVSAAAPSTPLATVGLSVAGILSRAEFSFGDPTVNFVTFIQLAPFAEVTGVAYTVALEAYAPSWLSELQVVFTDSAVTTGVIVNPGSGVDNAGAASFSDSGSLVPDGLNFFVGADGLLRVEFAEEFDDPEVAIDGKWVSGSVSFEVSAVPEPATYGLMALGLLGVVSAARRRSQA